MTSYNRYCKREYPSSSRRSSPDQYSLNPGNRESLNQRKSRSPRVGRISVSISSAPSQPSSHRSSGVYEHKSKHHSLGGYKVKYKSLQGYNDAYDAPKQTSEVDDLRIDLVRGNLKGVRTELEALKNYYADLERVERQRSVSRGFSGNKSGGFGGSMKNMVVENQRLLVPVYNKANYALNSTPSTSVRSYEHKLYDGYSTPSTPVRSYEHKYSTPHQPSYTLTSYPSYTPIAKTVSHSSYNPPRSVSAFPNLTTTTSTQKKSYNDTNDYKTYSIDYCNLYKDFQTPLYTPVKHVDRFPSEKYEISKLSRSQSTFPQYKPPNPSYPQTDLLYKPLKEFSLDHLHYQQHTLPFDHSQSLYHPHHNRSHSSQRIFDLNKLDNSLVRKELHQQHHSPYQPMQYNTPRVSRRNSEMVQSSYHTSPYQNASYHDIIPAPRPHVTIEEPRSVSMHSPSNYHRSSSYLPSSYSSTLYSPPSAYEPLDVYVGPYKPPAKIKNLAPLLSPISHSSSHSLQSYRQQPTHVSTHNVIFNSQPVVGVQNSPCYIKDYGKRKIHTVKSVTDYTEDDYKPINFNKTTTNYNITTTKHNNYNAPPTKHNYNAPPTKHNYNMQYSTIEPISNISHKEYDLLFKKYNVDYTQTNTNRKTDRHIDKEEEVGTKVIHVRPRRCSEVYNNTYNSSYNSAYNQLNNVAKPRNKIKFFNVAPRNDSSSWVKRSESNNNTNIQNYRNNNTDYHDAHFFESRNKQPQQVVTPPTRITAPQDYVKKRN